MTRFHGISRHLLFCNFRLICCDCYKRRPPNNNIIIIQAPSNNDDTEENETEPPPNYDDLKHEIFVVELEPPTYQEATLKMS